MSSMRQIAMFLLAGMTLLSVLMFVETWDLLQRYGGAPDWPSTQGKVLSAELGSSGSTGARTQASKVARVRYGYHVNGLAYQSQRVAFAYFDSAPWRDPERVLREFPYGRTVKVYYAPTDPARATLSTDLSALYLRLATLPLLALVLFGVWWIGRRSG